MELFTNYIDFPSQDLTNSLNILNTGSNNDKKKERNKNDARNYLLRLPFLVKRHVDAQTEGRNEKGERGKGKGGRVNEGVGNEGIAVSGLMIPHGTCRNLGPNSARVALTLPFCLTKRATFSGPLSNSLLAAVRICMYTRIIYIIYISMYMATAICQLSTATFNRH